VFELVPVSPDLHLSRLGQFHAEDSRFRISELFNAGRRAAIAIIRDWGSKEKSAVLG
jgi:hypothetical protein